MCFLSHRNTQETEELKTEPATDDIADVVWQSQRFERNDNSPRAKESDNQENSVAATTDATHFEVTTPDLTTPDEASDLVSEVEDDEFEAQWKDVEKLAKEVLGKDLEEFAEEYLADLSLRVDESIAQIDSLFEDKVFYEAQLEPLKQQKNWTEFSVAWGKFRDAERLLYGLYVFLGREGPAREHFGPVYLSTPEYAKLKTFAEDWYEKQEKRTVYR